MSRLYIKKLIPAKTYVDEARKLLKRRLEYISGFPYNCGYCHSDMHISGDCWCINPKTMVWSIAVGQPVGDNYTAGKYYYFDGINASGLPDWLGGNIMEGYCDKISFSSMIYEQVVPSLLLTADEEHMGAYIGEWTENGLIYNVCEFTPAIGISPGMKSYVDEYGYRYTCKGGAYVGRWGTAGRMTGIIDYNGEPTPTPTPQPSKPWSIDNVAIYCIRGAIPDGTVVPTGFDNRVQFFGQYGYTEDDIRQAQDIINEIYRKRDMDLLAVDIAMQFIGGIRDADGNLIDGVTRRLQWVADTYPDYDAEKLFRMAQDKVNWYAEK